MMLQFSIEKQWPKTEESPGMHLEGQVQVGKITGIYGPSGAGKTTLLRLLTGLLTPDKGYIKVEDNYWFDRKNKVIRPPQQRKIAYVFQDYALFPNMTVRKNLQYAQGKNGQKKHLDALLDIMDLNLLANRKPTHLSGGEKQRVALARAIAQEPDFLLLDEALSALDDELRAKMQDYILQLHHHFNLTTLMVSHDVSEIFKMCDQVLVLDKGRISQSGSALEIFSHRTVHANFQLVGKVLRIEQEDILFILTVMVGQEIVQVVADPGEIKGLKVGDTVVMASKAFNPLIRKL